MSFSKETALNKLQTLNATQQSIQSTSQWCLFHHRNHETITQIWLNQFQSPRISSAQRLNLFYLSNDLLQLSKKDAKHRVFLIDFGKFLPGCISFLSSTLSKNDPLLGKYLRCFRVWKDRKVYDDAFIEKLSHLLKSGSGKRVTIGTTTSPSTNTNSVAFGNAAVNPALVKLNSLFGQLEGSSDAKSARATIIKELESILKLQRDALVKDEESKPEKLSHDVSQNTSIPSSVTSSSATANIPLSNGANGSDTKTGMEIEEEVSPGFETVESDDDDDDDEMPAYTQDGDEDGNDTKETHSENKREHDTDGMSSSLKHGPSSLSSSPVKRVRFSVEPEKPEEPKDQGNEDLTALLTKLS
ncbi:unnamed protein product [Ambrosiozyma monospora]|uniref:Unnamed protein product n=1 Tax=Ambrosiozyma monospora TaxID=43982 RepID=A0A9W6YTD3_AMBMO|nr:unnamed protein product [Ambrosiozyma monospora]